jgi:Flp pilus assembly pilin Flp
MEVFVGLSEKEQKVLEELERQLTGGKAEKPKTESKPETKLKYARLLVAGSLLVVIGLSLLVFATSLHQVWLGVGAFLTMLTGLYLVSQNWSGRAYRAAKSAPKTSSSKENFFQKRWDDRNNRG